MFNKNMDTFIVNQHIGSNTTDFIIEGEVTIPDSQFGIEKVLLSTGEVNINSAISSTDKVIVNADLLYSIIYRSNNENSSVKPLNGKISFSEEIPINGAEENMIANTISSIDYLDTKIIDPTKIIVKSVVNISCNISQEKNISPINATDNNSLELKTESIEYNSSDIIHKSSILLDEYIELDINSNEIEDILKIDVFPILKEVDAMNDRVLIEGISNIFILYSEKNNPNTLSYISKELPFTHYIEANNLDNIAKDNLHTNVNTVSYTLSKDDNNENKIINLKYNVDLTIKSSVSNAQNYICDGYSTTNEVNILIDKIDIVSNIDKLQQEDTFEKTFTVENSSIKDIFYYTSAAKISDKKIFDDNIVIDGFLDINVIFFNGDNNKIDNVYQSIPFSNVIDRSDNQNITEIEASVTSINSGAYRKSLSSILFESTLLTNCILKESKTINYVSNLEIGDKLNYKTKSSIIFRVVQPNESIWNIAKSYNVSQDYICKLNNISLDSSLNPGEKLIVTKQI